jgi:hypothetical protein
MTPGLILAVYLYAAGAILAGRVAYVEADMPAWGRWIFTVLWPIVVPVAGAWLAVEAFTDWRRHSHEAPVYRSPSGCGLGHPEGD